MCRLAVTYTKLSIRMKSIYIRWYVCMVLIFNRFVLFCLLQVVELLLKSEVTQRLLLDSAHDEVDNERTTCLHLAAQNGHTEVVK